MTRCYRSRYGMIVKRCPGLHEYWYRGKLVVRGMSISTPDPRIPPTAEDWRYCVDVRGGGR